MLAPHQLLIVLVFGLVFKQTLKDHKVLLVLKVWLAFKVLKVLKVHLVFKEL
jgi:hypothetical protein